MKVDKGIIFDIQRFCIHDGPGIRTVVFLKGCPLRCPWCSNPESQELKPELYYIAGKCMSCMRCVNICPTKAITDTGGKIKIDRSKCIMCGKCIESCPTRAILLKGKEMTLKDVVKIVQRDEVFYSRSGGGATISGGDVVYQHEFAVSLLKELKKYYINTAIETSGHTNWETLKTLLEYSDIVLYDLKHVNNEIHRKFTGVSNELLLQNLIRAVSLNINLTIRIPLIPGFNMDEESIDSIIGFLKGISARKIDLLPFHQLGSNKYECSGKDYTFRTSYIPKDTEIKTIESKFRNAGFSTTVGG